MKDILDTHTHTLASGHAYSTIRENVKAAAQKGLELLAITEHAPTLPGSCGRLYFRNLRIIPRDAYEVPLLMGAELNILDPSGKVDLEEPEISRLDIGIASLHMQCMKPGTRLENTSAYINAMKNPRVNIIGHPDDGKYEVDYEALVQAAKDNHVLIELNNSSLRPGASRKNARENDLKILEYCREYWQPIVMGSDAHIDLDVGNHEYCIKLLEEIHFPEKLIINSSAEKLKEYLDR